MKDILDMSLPQLEMIIEGIHKNNKEKEDALNNVREGNALDFVEFITKSGGKI